MELILYFIIYSFLGWIVECIYCVLIDRVWVNRGFLNGPVCPVYGVGSIAVIWMLQSFKGNYLMIFILAVIVTTIVEYITAVILERAFDLKWWDYSTYKYNYKGRVCLLNSTLFGIMSIVLIEGINPKVVSFVNSIGNLKLVTMILLSILAVDFIITVSSLINLKEVMSRINKLNIEINIAEFINTEKFNDSLVKGYLDKAREIKEKNLLKEKLKELYKQVYIVKDRSVIQRRIFRAFPNLNSKKYNKQFKEFKKNLIDYWNKKK